MKKTVIFLILLSVIFTCNASAKYNELTLGSDTFCIPKKFNTLDQTTGPLFNLPGLDRGPSGGSFQTSVGLGEVKKNIPGYHLKHGDLPASLIVNVRRTTTVRLEKSIGRKYYADVLQLVNGYENAEVQYDKKNNFYRVSDWGGGPPFVLWEVLKLKPGKRAVLPENLQDYHLASCSRAGGTTGKNGTSSMCDYSIRVGDYLVNVTTTENNLNLKTEMNDFVKMVLVSWRENCD